MMLGLGLSITNIAVMNQGNRTPQPTQLLKTAIQKRCRVTCKVNGKTSVMEPYALHKDSGKTLLNAVVIYSDRKSFRKFQIKEFEVAALSEIVVTDDKFFPNWAFNASSIDTGNLIAAVELVEYFQNRQEPNASANVG